MKVVGVTGTVGAGKSTVSRLFEEWGGWRIDADRLAREAVAPGSPAVEEIRREWGEEVFTGSGELDRKALRRIVFRDDAARRKLESIVHPEVERLRRREVEKAREAGAEVVVAEVPLLFEAGLRDRFDAVVAVDAPREVRRRRVTESRDVTAETFDAMDEAQWPGKRKREAADHVILNDGDRPTLERRARQVWERIAGDGGPEEVRWDVDLHLHTRTSFDCLSRPEDVVRRAREVGLHRIAVTDHDEIEGALEARDLAPDLVIVGEEVRTAEGLELIGLFLEERIPPGGSFREVSAAIREQGGVVYLPHPFDPGRGAGEEFLDPRAGCLDAVEGFNARVHRPGANRRAMDWARERGLPVGAGSDAHLLTEIGRGRIRLPPFRGPEAFLEALERAELVGRASGRWVHLGSTWARVRKKLPVPLRDS